MICSLFFNKKYMNGPIFLDSYVKSPIFMTFLIYAHIFRSEIFQSCLSSWYYMRGVGGGVGGNFLYMAYGCACRIAPFFSAARYVIGPLFSTKNGPIFLNSCVKGPIFLTSWYMHIFFAKRFFEAALSSWYYTN